MAIRRHQPQSNVIRRSSDVIRRSSDAISGDHLLPYARSHLDELLTWLITHRYPSCMRFEAGALDHLTVRSANTSEVIRGHQRSSEVIRGHQRSSEVIRGHQRSSEVIRADTLEGSPRRAHRRAYTYAVIRAIRRNHAPGGSTQSDAIRRNQTQSRTWRKYAVQTVTSSDDLARRSSVRPRPSSDETTNEKQVAPSSGETPCRRKTSETGPMST